MADSTSEDTKTRPSGIVEWGEVLQLLSVVSIGLMLIVPITNLRHPGQAPSYGGWWIILAAVAITGLVWPFLLPDPHDGQYSWDTNRVETLKLVLPDKTADIVAALTTAKEKSGNAEELRNTVVGFVGDERAAQFLPTLYRYLRVTSGDRNGNVARGPQQPFPPTGIGEDKLSTKELVKPTDGGPTR